MSHIYSPDLLYLQGKFIANHSLVTDDGGRIARIAPTHELHGAKQISLTGKALVPGFVNAHSHAFQRLIRAKSESRALSGRDFWSWRGTMYHAAAQLTPTEVYDVARMAFLEMLLAGITMVGEFHYLHTDPSGKPYEDPNLLAKQVIAAARSVGLSITLLRSAYLRSGYGLPPDVGQTRFFESAASFLSNMDELLRHYSALRGEVSFGVAPHSLRAVPLDAVLAIAEWTRARHLPLHMHVSEQVAENEACAREYGETPVTLLSRHGILDAAFTAIHATHVREEEYAALSEAGSVICACPSTERNLGDGIFAADKAMQAGICIALGSDSQAQIDPLEDARELEYHLRLRDQKRAILDRVADIGIAERLLACATRNGAQTLAVKTGEFGPGFFADGFTIALQDVSLAGCSAQDLPAALVFSMQPRSVRDVIVRGEWIVKEGEHPLRDEIVNCYTRVHRKVWLRNPGSSAL